VGASAFGADVRPASFDGVVYTLGNSSGHLATVELALRYPGWIWLHEVRLPAIATTALDGLDDDLFGATMSWLLARAYPGRPPVASARRAGRSNLDLLRAGVGLVAPLAERCRGFLVNSDLARSLLLLDLAPLAQAPPIHVLPPACPPVRARPDTAAGGDEALAVAFGVVSMSKRPDVLVDAAAIAGCRLAFVGPCPAILEQVIGDRARARGIEERVHVAGAVDDKGWVESMDQATIAVQLRESASGETSAAVLDALASGVPVATNLATAAEYPEGTVYQLPSSEVEEVAAHLRKLVHSPDHLSSLSRTGQAFAADHQFDRLAQELVSVVTRWEQ
jgi:glycosyltransferase involved in cell wall biosynthesis